MNPEQLKSALRSVIIGVSGLVAGWFASRGWISTETITAILNSEVFGSILTAIVGAAWGVWAKTTPNLLVIAASVTDDKGKKLVTEMKLTDPKIAAQVNPQVTATVTAAPATR